MEVHTILKFYVGEGGHALKASPIHHKKAGVSDTIKDSFNGHCYSVLFNYV